MIQPPSPLNNLNSHALNAAAKGSIKMAYATLDKALFNGGYAKAAAFDSLTAAGPNPLVGSNPTRKSTCLKILSILNMLRKFIRKF
jgi:hypothetical protein